MNHPWESRSVKKAYDIDNNGRMVEWRAANKTRQRKTRHHKTSFLLHSPFLLSKPAWMEPWQGCKLGSILRGGGIFSSRLGPTWTQTRTFRPRLEWESCRPTLRPDQCGETETWRHGKGKHYTRNFWMHGISRNHSSRSACGENTCHQTDAQRGMKCPY